MTNTSALNANKNTAPDAVKVTRLRNDLKMAQTALAEKKKIMDDRRDAMVQAKTDVAEAERGAVSARSVAKARTNDYSVAADEHAAAQSRISQIQGELSRFDPLGVTAKA